MTTAAERAQVRAWRAAGLHLPTFMRDFHDQEDLFRTIHELTRPQDGEAEPIDWVEGQVYTIDTFLWCMARFGYTLQKSRAHQPFEDLETTLQVQNARRETQATAALHALLSPPSEA